MVGRIALLLGTSAALAVAANAVSPRGIPWNAPVHQTLRARALQAGLVPLGLEELRRLPTDVSLVDARLLEHYEAGHLPNALSIPWEDRERRLAELKLPTSGRLVVYCGSAYCDVGLRLGAWLRSRGFADVGLFLDGYDAWSLRGR